MNLLDDVIIKRILLPATALVTSSEHRFPSGSSGRRLACHRVIDCAHVLAVRIGFEMTRQHMTQVLQAFFVGFDARVHLSPNATDTCALEDDVRVIAGTPAGVRSSQSDGTIFRARNSIEDIKKSHRRQRSDVQTLASYNLSPGVDEPGACQAPVTLTRTSPQLLCYG